jgi:4-hydroxy-tetrahydrodipicolinate reductase
MKPRLAVIGAGGRVGRRIIALASESSQFDIVAATEKSDHPDSGRDAGVQAGAKPLGINISDLWPSSCDVAIDFSSPDAAESTVGNCLSTHTALVMGTTGLNPAQKSVIEKAGTKIPIIYGTNMSVGMNVLFSIVAKVAAMLGEEYDIEIVEEHHRFKKDAPSGSALTLAENICKAMGRPFPGSLTHGRNGKDALRQKNTIGMHAIRAGDITGVHDVIYSTIGETITLNHTAHSRDTFVGGALRAAQWLVGKKPGLYTMMDVLGIK